AGTLGIVDGACGHIKMNATVGTEIHIKGDLIIGNNFNGPSYTAAGSYGTLLLVLNGTTNQNILNATVSASDHRGALPSLKIDKISGLVGIDGPITISENIDFVKGIVIPANPLNTQDNLHLSNDYFFINSSTTVSNASAASYCEGPIRCRTGKTIELPIGKNGKYRPLVIDAVSGVSIPYSSVNTFTAEYFDLLPIESVTSMEAPLVAVSNCEVWAIQKDDAMSDTHVQDLELGFNATSCTAFMPPPSASDECFVVVSHWNHATSKWTSHGNGGIYALPSGVQTLKSLTDFVVNSDFKRNMMSSKPDLITFGYVEESICGDCDVYIYADYCVEACEFTFDPLYDLGAGGVYTSIYWDFGDGNSSTDLNPSHTYGTTGVYTVYVTAYSTVDGEPCNATYGFRVYANDCTPGSSSAMFIETEFIGAPQGVNNIESEVISDQVQLNISPNPSYSGQIQLNLKTSEMGMFKYEISNNQGEKLKEGSISSGENKTLNTSSLALGVYFITVYLSNEKITKRIIIGK
ncbi:MAG: T9SS type A sorting domain-containing protein, partial [Flavobacteriales bacterium]|nr:T9SS type A sorting domain-containing protein [Flavobacteriales bacterium]